MFARDRVEARVRDFLFKDAGEFIEVAIFYTALVRLQRIFSDFHMEEMLVLVKL